MAANEEGRRVDPTGVAGSRVTNVDTDDIYPRCEEERYRLYAVIGDERRVLATAANGPGIGLAIITLHEDAKACGRRLADEGRIGILDTLAGARGEWVITPYDRRPA